MCHHSVELNHLEVKLEFHDFDYTIAKSSIIQFK